MRLFVFFCSIGILLSFGAKAQSGGEQSFTFLLLPTSTQQNPLGKVNVAALQSDLHTAIYYPASLDSSHHQVAGITYQPYIADIAHTTLAYAMPLAPNTSIGFGMQYIKYGEMQGYSTYGTPTTNIQAKDWAVQTSLSYQLSPFSIGIGLKYARSVLGTQQAGVIGMDWGARFRHPHKAWVIAAVVKNIQLLSGGYLRDSPFSIPVEIQLGSSVQAEGMPIRLHFNLHHLQRLHLLQADGSLSYNNGSPQPIYTNPPSFTAKMASHIVVGGEFVVSKSLVCQLGYNYLHRVEMREETGNGLLGFSYGIRLRLKKFAFSIARNALYIQGTSTQFGLLFYTNGSN